MEALICYTKLGWSISVRYIYIHPGHVTALINSLNPLLPTAAYMQRSVKILI